MYLYITVYPPLLFCLCFFSSSSSSCFFGTLAKVFAFSIKKRKKREELFFAFLVPLFSRPFPAPLKETKKKRALFFLLQSDANKQTNANTSLRLKSATGGRVQKDDARLKKVLFLFCCVVLCSCFLIRMLFRFERRERRNHQKSPKKERKNSLGPKNSGSSSSSSFFCSKNEPPKNEGGYKINSGSCRKLLSLNYNWGQFKFQLAS